MSRIPLTGGYTMMPEGETVLMIKEATYKEDFGKVKLTLVNSKGQKHFENFTLVDKDGNTNDGACGAFSALAKTALRDPEAENVDVDELVGTFIKAEIAYREYEGNDGKTKKTTTKAEGTWWEEVTDAEIAEFQKDYTPPKKADKPKSRSTVSVPRTTAPAKATGTKPDLKSILGR